MRAVRPRFAGFSLIEVVVATGVLVVGVLGLAQVLLLAAVRTSEARAVTTATILARGKMEELRAADWPTLTPSPPGVLGVDTPGFVDYLDASGAGLARGAGVAFVRRWSILPLPSDPTNAVVLQVLVETAARHAAQTRLLSVRTRWE